jgi:hypothetical protein
MGEEHSDPNANADAAKIEEDFFYCGFHCVTCNKGWLTTEFAKECPATRPHAVILGELPDKQATNPVETVEPPKEEAAIETAPPPSEVPADDGEAKTTAAPAPAEQALRTRRKRQQRKYRGCKLNWRWPRRRRHPQQRP